MKFKVKEIVEGREGGGADGSGAGDGSGGGSAGVDGEGGGEGSGAEAEMTPRRRGAMNRGLSMRGRGEVRIREWRGPTHALSLSQASQLSHFLPEHLYCILHTSLVAPSTPGNR